MMRTKTMAVVMAMVGASGLAMAQQEPGQPRSMPGQSGQPGQPSLPGQPNQPGQTGRDTMRPGLGQQDQQKLTSTEVQNFTQGWGQDRTEVVRTLTSKYGQPTEGTRSMLIWKDPKPTGGAGGIGEPGGIGGQPGGGAEGGKPSSGIGQPGSGTGTGQPGGGGINEANRPGQPGGMNMTSGNNTFKRIVVYREGVQHRFPQAHEDFLETVVSYKVPADKLVDLVEFDGSLVYNRTKGELSAFCHKEEANIVALNLAHDIVTGSKDVDEAKQELTRLASAIEQGQKPRESTQLSFRPDPSAADPGTPARILGTPEDEDRPGMKLDDPKLDKPGLDKPKPGEPRDPGMPPRQPGGGGGR